VLPITDRPNKVQKLSLGAYKVKRVPGGSLREFGPSPGSATTALQVLPLEDARIEVDCTWASIRTDVAAVKPRKRDA
jgi:hypothetical protein